MMWGDRPPRAKLTGDSRRGFEAVLIGDSGSARSLATNWPLRLLRLLQQYGHKTELRTGPAIVRFPRKTGSPQRTVRMTNPWGVTCRWDHLRLPSTVFIRRIF